MNYSKSRKKRIFGIFGIILSVFLLIGSVGALFSVFRNREDEYYSYSSNISTTFSENSWKTIAKVFKSGKAAKYWNLGDTKEIELGDGYTYEVQIVDMLPRRYALSDGTGYSNGVLQFVKCLATKYAMNEENTNIGGFSDCVLRIELNTTVYDLLPDDLKSVISEVSVASGIGNSTISGTSDSDNKLFLASEYEIFGENINSIGTPEGSPQFGYWMLHNSDADHIKTRIDDTSATFWWLRSAFSPNSTDFCGVVTSGSSNSSGAYFLRGVCPCFAL